MKKCIYITTFLAGISLLAGSAQAREWGPDFSADMVMTNPDNPSQSKTAQFVSSKGRTSTSSKIPSSRAKKQGLGKVQIDIVNPYQGAMWRLFPDSKKYYEIAGEKASELPAPPMPGDTDHPCSADKGIKCTQLGSETINGRSTEKWEIVSESDDGTVTTTQWFDPELGVPVRTLVPGKVMWEYKSIKVAPQSDKAFMVPDGFEKTEPSKK